MTTSLCIVFLASSIRAKTPSS